MKKTRNTCAFRVSFGAQVGGGSCVTGERLGILVDGVDEERRRSSGAADAKSSGPQQRAKSGAAYSAVEIIVMD
jgi:hypothetical protein